MTSSWHGFNYIDSLRQLDRWVDVEGQGIARMYVRRVGNLSLLFFRLCNDEGFNVARDYLDLRTTHQKMIG